MIRGGVGFDALVRTAKHVFIEVAIDELFPKPSRTNISRLSVATGIPRREISAYLKPKRQPESLKGNPAARVLRGWRTDPVFYNGKGRPAELHLRGGARASFAALVKKHGGDVTPVAVLRELERHNTITTSKGKVRLRPEGLRALERAHRQWSAAGRVSRAHMPRR